MTDSAIDESLIPKINEQTKGENKMINREQIEKIIEERYSDYPKFLSSTIEKIDTRFKWKATFCGERKIKYIICNPGPVVDRLSRDLANYYTALGFFGGIDVNEAGNIVVTLSIDPPAESVSTGSADPSEPTDESVTIRLKPYGNTVPYLYVWDDTDTALLGAWPGTKPTEKDENGNYIVTIPNKKSVNVIANIGSNAGQTADITDVSGDVTIEITDAGCTTYKLTRNEQPLSGMALLREEGREVKVM